MTTDVVYLDNHATTRVDPRVLEAMWPWYAERQGNAGSINHPFGIAAREAVAAAREQVAGLIGAEPEEIVFTSGATEANNLAIKGLLSDPRRPGRLITSNIEHPSVLEPARRLKRLGHTLELLPVDEHGLIHPDQLRQTLTPETTLASLMLGNNEIGTIYPLVALGEICREQGVPLHSDATQAVGKISVDVATLPVDLLSFSAHKLYGPQGIGALYVRKREPRLRLEPLLHGGETRGLRSGTLPVALIVGFGRACAIARAERPGESRHLANLRDQLWQGLREHLTGLHRNGSPERALPGNLNVSFEGVDGDALMNGLKRIAVSSGAACSTDRRSSSPVLRALGREEPLARASLRFGIGRFNSRQDINLAIEEVVRVVTELRGEVGHSR